MSGVAGDAVRAGFQPVGRGGWIALAGSIALHAVALFGVPPMDLAWLEPKAPPPIEARIVAAPSPAPDVVAAPPVPKVAPKPRPRPVAKRAPEPAPAAAALTPPPEPPVSDATTSASTPDASQPAPVAAADAVASEPASAPPASDAVPAPDAAVAAATPADVQPPIAPPGPPIGNVTYPIRRAEIVYDLSWGAQPVRIGQVRHTFLVEGDRYRAETVAEATGLFSMLYGGQYVQRSRGRLGPDGLVPDEYFVMRGKPERAERATFDWAANKVAFTRRDERQTAEVATGAQDPISMLHQLYFFQPLPQVAMLDIATSRKVNTYEYERAGNEVLQTPFGLVETVHLVRVDEDSDRLELWLDPARGYLPLKLYFRDRKGTIFEQTVRALDVVPADGASGPPAQATHFSENR